MKRLFAVTGVIVFAAWFAFAQDPAATAPPELERFAHMLGEEARLVNAVRQYDLVRQALAEWNTTLAMVYRDTGEVEKARAHIEEARRHYDAIRRAYEETLERYPKNARAVNYYGELLYDIYGEQAQAVRRWHEAEKLDPKLSLAVNNLALHYSHSGQIERGLDYLDKLLKMEKDNPDYLFSAAQIYFNFSPEVQRRKKWDAKRLYREAMKLSKKAAELDPDNFENLQDYAINFFGAERYGVTANWRDAAKAWQAARAKTSDPAKVFNTWLNEARVYIEAGDDAKARQALQQALAILPGSDVAKNLLAKLDEKEKAGK